MTRKRANKEKLKLSHCRVFNNLKGVKNIKDMSDKAMLNFATPGEIVTFNGCGKKNAYQCNRTDCINYVE